MATAKAPRLFLIHIRDCCERILDDTSGVESIWPDVPVIYDAVCRNLEITGEAARKIDETFRAGHPEIPPHDQVAGDLFAGIVSEDIPPPGAA